MKLNLPNYPLRLKNEDNKQYIFDEFRKKFLVCTPEEWVRQHFLHYMVHEKEFPKSLIAVEQGIKIEGNQLRCDIVAYDRKAKPLAIVECKAPEVKITQETFNQILRYNYKLQVPYLIVTNGISHFCCHVDYATQKCKYLEQIPLFNQMV